jgi:long-subunit fatty acid transport protein
MKFKNYFNAAIFLYCLLLSMPALTQPQQGSPWSFTIDGGGGHQTEADLEDHPGAFAVDKWFLGAGLNYTWSPRKSVGLSFGGGRSNYDFNDATGFGNGEPWDTIEDSRLSLSMRFGFGEKGMAFIIPTVRINAEKGASNSDSRTYGLFGAFAWRLDENLTIGPGFGVFSRLEGSTQFFPILAIDWNFAERWNLSTGSGLASSRGPGLTLTYKINEDWDIGFSGRYEDQEFRLDDKGVAAGGVGRDQSFPLVFRADLKPNPNMNFALFAGVAIGGELKLKDASDVLLEKSDYELTPLFGASFDFRF